VLHVWLLVRTGLLTTGLFLMVLPAASVVNAAVTRALAGEPAPIGHAPAGEDPVACVVLILVFGGLLVAAVFVVLGGRRQRGLRATANTD
jgi:hypothetical protein